jgi:hypothetical protein
MKKLFKVASISLGFSLFILAVICALFADAVDSMLGYFIGAYKETLEVFGMFKDAVKNYWSAP